jgi:hypothetical protein
MNNHERAQLWYFQFLFWRHGFGLLDFELSWAFRHTSIFVRKLLFRHPSIASQALCFNQNAVNKEF